MSIVLQPPTVAEAGRLAHPLSGSVARATPRTSAPPPLTAGDRLTRTEFERRYLAHPEIKQAELIEGVVYMPSPTRFEKHGRPHNDIVTWLGVYRATTFGVVGGN
ncbi:MAG: hypothetical protein QG637_641, partial [Chloroflexota bacterium]|nr:hypothetical protein [Chloroflexota bacterium]